MLDPILEKCLGQLINAACGGIVAYLWARYKEKSRENTALKLGLQALLRDRIIQAYNNYVDDKGWIPIYAKESLDACYKSYEALGENGVVDDLMRQINKLPNHEPHND